MSKPLAIILFVIGVFGLMGFAAFSVAPSIEARVHASAVAVVEQSNAHESQVRTLGRDVFVFGLVDRAEERAELLASLNQVSGRRRIFDSLGILPLVEPFRLTAAKTQSGTTVSGHVPDERTRHILSVRLGADTNGLILATGEPPGDWNTALETALLALDASESAALLVEDAVFRLTGSVDTDNDLLAIDDLVAAMPEGFVLITELDTIRDFVAPFHLELEKTVEGRFLATGFSESEIRRDALVKAIEAQIYTDDFEIKIRLAVGAPLEWHDFVLERVSAIGTVSSGRLVILDKTVSLVGVVHNPEDMVALEEHLAEIGGTWNTDITVTSAAVETEAAIDFEDEPGDMDLEIEE